MGIKFDIITHHFMLEFVDYDLYFVQDENNFINPLLQVGMGMGMATQLRSVEKSTGSGSSSLEKQLTIFSPGIRIHNIRIGIRETVYLPA